MKTYKAIIIKFKFLLKVLSTSGGNAQKKLQYKPNALAYQFYFPFFFTRHFVALKIDFPLTKTPPNDVNNIVNLLFLLPT